jgi:DnaJ-class molecular chaperone
MNNPYSTLGVAKGATADTIKRAYKEKAKEHHPDRGGDANKFAEISNAYDILKDPSKRAYYDHTGSTDQQRASNQQQGFHFNDIFSQMFRQQQQRQAEARINISISLKDSIAGGKRIIGVNTPQGNTSVEIDIPRGVVHGESIKYPKAAPGGIDLVVNFRIQGDPRWQRNGLDMHTEREVDFWMLILGGDITVVDVLGKKYDVRIPPRTNPGTTVRLGSAGVFRDRHNPGDIFVKIKATMPKNIPEEVIATIKKYQQ